MTRYTSEETDTDSEILTNFVQIATFKSVQNKFGEGDKVIIFTTKGSMGNWNGDANKNGLHKELLDLNLSCDVENVDVKNGSTQEETWEIFQTIFDTLQNNDRLYVDITSGFRSLPLLILTLINYAKFLKDVSVAKIFYAFYDNTKAANPIRDLTDFSKLQDWTNNANIFLQTGNAKGLAQQIKGDTFKDVKEGLERFSEFTLVNRGMDIYKGDEIVKLSESLNTIGISDNPADKAARPIFEKVRDSFKPYQKDSAINGFHAARWCIENGLIQQAATILEEFVVSYLMTLVGLENMVNPIKRGIVLNKVKFGEKYTSGNLKDFSVEQEDEICANVTALPEFDQITDIVKTVSNKVRNDVNHAGFRSKPKPYKYIRETTIEQFNNLCDVLATRGHQIEKISL